MHLFRKYFNNRGSALFMVISTMTAVMISCMAMYFSVISSRSTQYVVYNQSQSQQTAVSISDAVLAGMMEGNQADFKKLVDQMWKLKPGEKLTTNGNGFAAFDKAGTGKDEDQNLGAYMMEITRISDSTFDIVVTTSVNGVAGVYHNVIDLEVNDDASAPPAPTQVFAATGYVPNDVFLDGGRFITDVFFDNEQTVVNAYGGKNMDLWGNLSTGGSLTVHGYLIPSKTKTVIYAVRGDYTAVFSQPLEFAPSPYEKSTVLIGGNCYLNGNNGFKNADVYVLGDLIITAQPTLDSGNYYVNGNVILAPNSMLWYDLDHVFCNNYVDCSKWYQTQWDGSKQFTVKKGLASVTQDGLGKTVKTWTEKSAEDGVMSVSQMVKTLNERTESNTYYKWIINDSSPTKDAYVKELNEKASTAVHKTLKFNQGFGDKGDGTRYPSVPTIVLKYGEEHGCIIDDIEVEKENHSIVHLTLVIDTGEDEDNVYTIRVKANRDMDGDGVNETFTWSPYTNKDSETVVSILVKGRGSVVIDVPPGVTYQDLMFSKFMHYGWYLLGGATPDTTKIGSGEKWNEEQKYWESEIIYNTTGIDTYGADVNYEKYIHTTCKDGDGCSYSEEKSSEKCSLHSDKDLVNIKCSVHGNLTAYCPECHSEKFKCSEHGKTDCKDCPSPHVGECVNHVGRKEIDAVLATNETLKKRMADSEGNTIYPTTNIFLVSCDESANIRLSIFEDGKTKIMQNSFFGYIYAPYMTFKACGDNAGGTFVRLMGGMTVSDYVIDDSMSMSACWPEKMPTDLMSSDCLKNKLQGIASRGWKVSLTGH